MDLCLVGYTYRGCPMSHGIERARAYGYGGIEVRDFADVDLSSPTGVVAALEQAVRLARQHDLAVRSLFYSPLPVSRDAERAEEETAFGEVLAILAQFQVPLLHTRLSLRREQGPGEVVAAGAREEDYQAVRETLQRVSKVAERCEVPVAIETHMGTIHDTAASQLRILASCPSPFVVASLDFANMKIAYREEPLEATIGAFGSRIGYAHLKNVRLLPAGYDWNVPLRWGDINYFRVLQALQTVGYTGPLAVEYCGTGDPDVFAEDDARYLKSLLPRLAGLPAV